MSQHDDGICPYVGEWEQLQGENTGLRALLRILLGAAEPFDGAYRIHLTGETLDALQAAAAGEVPDA